MNIGETLARIAEVGEDIHGANLVILAGEGDLEEIRDRAPAAVVLVVGDDLERRCAHVYETTRFPRARVVGVGEPAAAAEAIALQLDEEHDVVALADGEFGARRARLGRGGIRELL